MRSDGPDQPTAGGTAKYPSSGRLSFGSSQQVTDELSAGSPPPVVRREWRNPVVLCFTHIVHLPWVGLSPEARCGHGDLVLRARYCCRRLWVTVPQTLRVPHTATQAQTTWCRFLHLEPTAVYLLAPCAAAQASSLSDSPCGRVMVQSSVPPRALPSTSPAPDSPASGVNCEGGARVRVSAHFSRWRTDSAKVAPSIPRAAGPAAPPL